MKAKQLLIGLIALLLLAGCSTEIRMANRFLIQSRGAMAAIYFPETAQVTLIQDADGSYSRVLDSVSQDMFLDILYASYADELGRYGVEVYIPEDPDYVEVDSTHWLIVVSQVELQGLYTEYVDYLFDFLDEYNYPFVLNTVNVAAWFDINDGAWHPTMYDEHNLTDGFTSYVTHNNDGAQYHYDIDRLNADDVYSYAVFLGKRYAGFTYNYMMNHYIDAEMKKQGNVSRFKLKWNPYTRFLDFQEEDAGFIGLD